MLTKKLMILNVYYSITFLEQTGFVQVDIKIAWKMPVVNCYFMHCNLLNTGSVTCRATRKR